MSHSPTVFFTADTHFQHRMVSGLRGYTTIEQHDEALIDAWNESVHSNDIVWHLGDVAMKVNDDLWPLLDRLNGVIHLIAGNHDPCWPGNRQSYKHQQEWIARRFETVQPFARRTMAGTAVLLSHFSYNGDHLDNERYTQYRLQDCGLTLLHGHTHSESRLSWSAKRSSQIHVGWDAWHRPVAIDEVARML